MTGVFTPTAPVPGPPEPSGSGVRVPHLSVPLQRTGSRLAVVEQDSPADQEQRLYAVLNTRLGTRVDLPDFGSPDSAFSQGGVDLDELERSASIWLDFDVAAARESGQLAELAQGLDRVQLREGAGSGDV